jgi:hypothetical protein
VDFGEIRHFAAAGERRKFFGYLFDP